MSWNPHVSRDGRVHVRLRCAFIDTRFPFGEADEHHIQPIMGFVVAVFKPASPPTSPTPDAVWQGIVDTGTDYSWTVPSFVEVSLRLEMESGT